MLPDPTSVFIAYLVPNEGSTGYAGFSLCIELNANHTVFNSQDPVEIKLWKKQVLEYHNILSQQLNGLRLQVDNSVIDATVVLPSEEVKWKLQRRSIWAQFLGYKLTGTDWGIKSKSVRGRPTTEVEPQVVIAPDILPAMQSGNMDMLSFGKLPVNRDGSMQVLGVDNISTVVSAMITTASPGTLSNNYQDDSVAAAKAFKQGIFNATEAYVLSNAKRQQQIIDHPANRPFFDMVMNELQLNMSSRVGYAAIADKVDETETLDAAEKVMNMAKMQAYVELLENEPQYILKGLDELNKTPLLRRFFQTLIDVKVDLNLLPAPDINFAIKPVLANSNGFLNTDMVTRCSRSKLIPSIVLPQVVTKDTRHIASLLKIGTDVEARSYEPESVRENAFAVYTAYKELPVEIKSITLSLNTFQAAKQAVLLATTHTATVAHVAAMKMYNMMLQITRAANNRVSNIVTKGQSLYLTKPFDTLPVNNSPDLYMSDTVSGYAVFARKKGSKDNWVSLTAIQEKIDFLNAPAGSFQVTEMGIQINVGIQSTVDANGTGNGMLYDVKNNFLLHWDGTRVGGVNPMLQKEKEEQDTTDKVDAVIVSQYDVPGEVLSVQVKNKHVLGIDWFPYLKRKGDAPQMVLKRMFDMSKATLKLKFGEAYEYLLAAQFPNGYVPMKQFIESGDHRIEGIIATCKALPDNSIFSRHEHINQLPVSLPTNIYIDESGGVLKKSFYGESPTDLVVRSGTILNNNTCTRYILPPQVPNFQIYLWYKREGKLKAMQLNGDESADWYLRYQCATEDCKELNPPRVYNGQISYLPDPVVTGFVIRFYADPERKVSLNTFTGDMYQDTFCPYNSKNYPRWKAWEFVLRRDDQEDAITSKVTVEKDRQRVTVLLRKGMQLFVELVPAYLKDEAMFFPAPLADDTFFEVATPEYYYNTLYSNITKLTLTHASQLPVIVPALQDTLIWRNRKDGQQGDMKEESFKVETDIYFEHLNLWRGVPIAGMVSTGELALYGLWDDYSDNSQLPHKSIQEKRTNKTPDKGFIRLDTIKFAALQSEGPIKIDQSKVGVRDVFGFNIEKMTFTTQADLIIPHHSDLVLKVRNTSRFSSYFEGPRELTETEKEKYSSWSTELFLTSDSKPVVSPVAEINSAPYLYNNRKAPAPVIAKIIPLKVTDIYENGQKAVRERHNRVRFYFERAGMQFTGKGQRIGVVTDAGTAPERKYVRYFEGGNAVSIAGTDIVTVSPIGPKVNSTLGFSNFVLHDEKKFDLRQEGNMSNLISFLPKYDKQQDLWYLDIDINVTDQRKKEPHAVFIQLNFVYFQPYAANYNNNMEDSKAGYDKDYRLSDVVQADFVMINPTRTYYNHWSLLRRNSSKAFSFAPDIASLYFLGNSLKTQFFVFVQQRVNRIWYPVESTISGDIKGNAYFHSILPVELRPDAITREYKFNLDWTAEDGRFRVVMMEIDYFYEGEGLAHLVSVMNKTGMDDHYMPTDLPGVQLRNTFIISEASDDENLL